MVLEWIHLNKAITSLTLQTHSSRLISYSFQITLGGGKIFWLLNLQSSLILSINKLHYSCQCSLYTLPRKIQTSFLQIARAFDKFSDCLFCPFQASLGAVFLTILVDENKGIRWGQKVLLNLGPRIKRGRGVQQVVKRTELHHCPECD